MIIGIVGKVFETTFGITTAYGTYFEQFGKVIVLSPNHHEKVDLVVLPGGADVDSQRYGEEPRFWTSKPDPFLEYFDKWRLPEYVTDGVPIFGICRGIQTLNVLFGGTLHQDLRRHPYSGERDEFVHTIHHVEDKKHRFKVNSLHHQGIKQLGNGLITTYLSTHDGLPEAIQHENLRISAVQWHPEEIRDGIAQQMIEKLLGTEQL